MLLTLYISHAYTCTSSRAAIWTVRDGEGGYHESWTASFGLTGRRSARTAYRIFHLSAVLVLCCFHSAPSPHFNLRRIRTDTIAIYVCNPVSRHLALSASTIMLASVRENVVSRVMADNASCARRRG
ncbi:hypothetical protein BAUCODRAFT_332919 [Baudoinia panamericana UAMH 10762]|uniref:Uncharacterized protein n=1 Tax=Baudoinia panamericana (strain UAMH 10762) TaxID=717646 RepID=M2M385_BAUPA|nr:uncharacterized protein BAUCODRAFT_332919 [Baudoinia panamericana UAMH 10762]EMC90991.1 hypothetical protein BAUCODRAFT_332919 [Baudoinia panamericana UAMH 10762]